MSTTAERQAGCVSTAPLVLRELLTNAAARRVDTPAIPGIVWLVRFVCWPDSTGAVGMFVVQYRVRGTYAWQNLHCWTTERFETEPMPNDLVFVSSDRGLR